MKYRRNIIAGLTVASVAFASTSFLFAGQADYDKAVGQVSAAYEMDTTCNGVTGIGGGGYQAYIIAASELLAKQGLRRNKTKRLLFYGKTQWINQMKSAVLSARGVEKNNKRGLCSLARKIAGKNDAIGRFLVRK